MNPSSEKAIQDAIRGVVNEIPAGKVFDSHFVINQIIKLDSEAYLTFVAGRFASAASVTAAAANGQIALLIKNCSDVVRLEENGQPLESWSDTIHTTPSHCACWRKV